MSEVMFPYVNPIRMFDITDSAETFWYKMLPSFEKDPGFSQPFELGDTLSFQLAATKPTGSLSASAKLIDVNMVEIEDIPVSLLTKSYNADYYHYDGRLLLADIPEGYYWAYVTLATKTGECTIISDRLWIKQKWNNTMLLEYTHKDNNYDMIFLDGLENYSFHMRVHGGFKSDGHQPGSEDIFYKDQELDTVLLDSIPFLVRKLTFGDGRGIANYMANSINRAWCCSSVKKDGQQYTKIDGSKLERIGSDNYPLAAWTLDVIDIENSYSYGSKFTANAGIFMYKKMTYELDSGVNVIPLPVEGKQVASYQIWEVLSETKSIHQPNIQMEYDSDVDEYSIDMGEAEPLTVEIKFTLI